VFRYFGASRHKRFLAIGEEIRLQVRG